MEVMIHQVNREVVLEQPLAWRPDGSETAANGGVGSSEPVNVVKNDGFGLSKDSSRVYSDKNEDSTLQWSPLEKNLKVEDIDIPKLINSIINTQNPINNLKDKFPPILSFPTSSSEEPKHKIDAQTEESLKIDLAEESDEEVVELEFVRAVDKLHTHTPYCPNCSSQITRVILRRKKREDAARSADLDDPRRGKTLDLFGCLSCFSIFSPSGNVLNPFRLFRSKGKHESAGIVGDEQAPGVDLATEPRAPTDGNMFAKQGKQTEESNGGYKHISLDAIVPVISGHHVPLTDGYQHSGHTIKDGSLQPEHVLDITPTNESPPSDHLTANLGAGAVSENVVEKGSEGRGSEPVAIVKCMVYGGLMELITSLSVVSSAAASGASTLNILSLGLATLVSGVFVFGHNLVDMKNEVSERNSNEHQIDRYQEVLGKRGHFLLHATLAILSFLVFGLLPPVVYAFAFYESDNKDYKILVVAAVSFSCIIVLAAAQAYVRETRKATGYVKVVIYYVMGAVAASGVAYAAGDLIGMLMERLGWFGAGTPVRGGSGTTASWASY